MALVSSGQLLPAAGDYGAPYGPLWSQNLGHINLLTRSASYAQIFETQPWINTLVTKVASSASRLPFKIYERGTGDSRNAADDSPFGQLMANPNRRDDARFFWLWTVSTFELYGESLWVKARPRRGAAPTELWPMHPANVRVGLSDAGQVEYEHWATQTRWSADDMVHFRSYNPKDLRRGLSRLEPLRGSLTSEEAIRTAQEAIWRNGARPSVVLEHPKDIGEGPAKRLRADWESLYSGVGSWGKTAILEEGMKANVIQMSAADMQVDAFRKLSREEACGVYDVPPPVVHILDHATFSNITEQMRSMYRDTMAPRLGTYESVIQKQLRPDFDPAGRQYGEFLLDEVLRGDFETRADAYQKGITSGWIKPSEVRTLENMPDAGPEADRLYVNAALVPMSSQPSTPQREQETQTRELTAAPDKLTPDAWQLVQRSLMGRLSRVETVADLDVQKFVEGIPQQVAERILAIVDNDPNAYVTQFKAAITDALEVFR